MESRGKLALLLGVVQQPTRKPRNAVLSLPSQSGGGGGVRVFFGVVLKGSRKEPILGVPNLQTCYFHCMVEYLICPKPTFLAVWFSLW